MLHWTQNRDYERMTTAQRAAVGAAFIEASAQMRAYFGQVDMCDPAERVVAALVRWAKESGHDVTAGDLARTAGVVGGAA